MNRMRHCRFVILGLWLALFAFLQTSAAAVTLYVAADGNDTWSGRMAAANEERSDGPFASLQRARDEIRKLKDGGAFPAGGVTVQLAGGRYELAKTFELSEIDSGSSAAPIVYRVPTGETVRLSGGRMLSDWQRVSDPAILERLDPAARDNVMQADLRSAGVTDFGQMGGGFGQQGGPGLELFFNDQPMVLARGPNEGFIKITDVLGPTPVDVRGTKGCREGVFAFEGDRPLRWIGEKDAWVLGYWFWDWAEQRHKIERIDGDQRSMTLAPPYHGYGYRKGQWFYGFNILAELDSPGEWYLDRESGQLVFWPPAPIDKGQAVVSMQTALVTMNNVSYVTMQGLTFEAARGTAISIDGGRQNRLVACTLRNLGSWAVRISGGREHAVIGCDISATGDGGISLAGGDRNTLDPAGHVAENNWIHHWSRWNRMYRPGIMLSGVGQRAAHNLIEHSPHTAIGFGGNDHVIELNEIHHVCMESNDAGAMYAGRDWTMRGTVIRSNYLHHISGFENRGCVGVYLDDMFCGTRIFGNVFYEVTRAAFIGGGRDNVIENNLFVDCRPAVHVDARALGWAGAHAQGWIREGKEKNTLSGIRYNQPPYSTHYPSLVPILDEDPAAPRGNVIARNVCWGGRWDEIEAKARPLVTFQDNLLDQDPRLVDAAAENFQLRDDSPAFQIGFQRIPVDKIGLVPSDQRASWPVNRQGK